MRVPARHGPVRRGATLVEAAFVLPIFLLFVFGVFEYGRYLLVLHVSTNAAREGVRHGVVHATDLRTNDTFWSPPANYTVFSVHPVGPVFGEPTYGAGRTQYQVPFIEQHVRRLMGGVDGMIQNFNVRVFPCDTAQLYATPCVVMPKSSSTTWSNAAFSERIAVRVVGQYRPILPSFLGMSDPIPVNTTALMGSEG